MFDYNAEEEDELSFREGDILYVVDSSDPDWWKARCKGVEGLIPTNMVESASGDGSTGPMHDAAKRGNLELLRECLSNRMPVNQADPAGNSPLHWAARSGQLDCLTELLGVAQIGLDKTNKLGDTPLILAAQHAHAHCVEALIKVNKCEKLSNFIFSMLSSKAGADASKTNNDGKSVRNMSLDSEVLVVLKKYNVIKGVNNGFNDDEYNNDEEDEDEEE